MDVFITVAKHFLLLICVLSAVFAKDPSKTSPNEKHKRQLFREQVLPSQGGKIPEGALKPNRLALNRLNQQGIYTLDGIYLEQRIPQVYFHPKQLRTDTLKLAVPQNGYATAAGGLSYSPRSVDTTYLIRTPVKAFVLPIPTFNQNLPLLPYTSLKLLYRNNHNYYNLKKTNYYSSPNDFSDLNLKEFAPYLAKIHEYDND